MKSRKSIKQCSVCGRTTKNKKCKKCSHLNTKSLRDKFFKEEYLELDIPLTFSNILKLYSLHKTLNFKFNHNILKFIKYHIKLNTKDFITNMLKIVNIKNTSAISLENCIIRYGIEEGTRRYNEKNIKCSNTLETFIARHGENGEKLYKEYLKSKDSSSLEASIRRYGVEEGTRRYNEKCKANSDGNSLQGLQEKYGVEEGKKIYEERIFKRKITSKRSTLYWENIGYTKEESIEKVKQEQSRSKSYYKKKYGDIVGLVKFIKRNRKWQKTLKSKPQEEIDEINSKKAMTVENYIRKYGEEEGTRRYNNFCKSCSKRGGVPGINSLDFYVTKHGAKGFSLYKERQMNRLNKLPASKESMLVFTSLIDMFSRYNIYVGTEDSQEYVLLDDETKRRYLYDFTIPELKLIIEYHGEAFHPNPKWEDDIWNNWSCVYSNESADEKHKVDLYKKYVATQKGFNVLELWSSDSIEYNINKAKEFISSLALP